MQSKHTRAVTWCVVHTVEIPKKRGQKAWKRTYYHFESHRKDAESRAADTLAEHPRGTNGGVVLCKVTWRNLRGTKAVIADLANLATLPASSGVNVMKKLATMATWEAI